VNSKILSIFFLILISNTTLLSQDGMGVFYLFDISKSYKLKSLDEAIEVADATYNIFTDRKGLGSISPQYHLSGTIDAKSIKATKPCTTTYKKPAGGVFNQNENSVKADISPCLNKISNMPYSMFTDIRGGVYNAGNSMLDNLDWRGLIIFSDMDNDPVQSFQKKLPLDNLTGITVLMLYSHTQASQKGNITDKYVEDFKDIFKKAGAKDVQAWPLQSIAVQGESGGMQVAKYFRSSFKREE